MIYRKLVALFDRYAAVHLNLAITGSQLHGPSGDVVGHVDRIVMRGQRLTIEGWADADTLVLRHAGQFLDLIPNLPRADVTAAHPALQSPNPGFTGAFTNAGGGVTLTLVHNGVHFVHSLPMPDAGLVRHARIKLIAPFLRDLFFAAPIVMHWLATKNPNDRVRLKQRLRLDPPVKAKIMQPLLFLPDGMTAMTCSEQRSESARQQSASHKNRGVTIVLPIYNALDLLPDVLDRVARNTDLPWRLILIEDASSDPDVRPFLQRWVREQPIAKSDRITLIENAQNQGFIRSVNAGLKLAIGYGDHVVLLNSDAFVPKGWASRLMRPFQTHDRVATVTPMSNDAEIFSAPVICAKDQLSFGHGDLIDATATRMHPDAALAEAPTGVGFCMAMSIEYLHRLPVLDTAFGRGYGEEVDWCQKVRAMGGRHLGLANLFIEHRGGTSFGSGEKRRLVARNNAEISRRYPAYDADVRRFIETDPLAAPRLALAIAWAAARAAGPIPIYLAHNMGGGAEDYLTQRIARDMPDVALVLRVGTALRWQLELHAPNGITRGATADFTLIQQLLSPVDRLHIIYSCGVGDSDPSDLPARMAALKRGPQDTLEILLHDFLPISPSYTLLGSSGHFVGLPNPNTHDHAHWHRLPDGTQLSLADWQTAWLGLVSKASVITAFSNTSADLFAGAYETAKTKLRVRPHDMLVDLPQVPAPMPGNGAVIGILGNIGYHKGAGVLRDLSKVLGQTGVTKLVVLGKIDPMYALGAPAIVHGGYQRADIPALAARYGITDWLIPSIWPETFSYTTHEAIATGLPVWCFDLGAQADAVRQICKGGVIPMPAGVPDLNALLGAILHDYAQSSRARFRPNPESRAA